MGERITQRLVNYNKQVFAALPGGSFLVAFHHNMSRCGSLFEDFRKVSQCILEAAEPTRVTYIR